MSKGVHDIIRSFGMANQMAEVALDGVEGAHSIDLGRPKKNADKDTTYYPQFDAKIRKDAADMARHYEIFFCLEQSIRSLIDERLKEHDTDYWDEKIPEHIRVKAKGRHEKEIGQGVTPRSYNLLDYTDFGELSVIIDMNWNISFNDIFTNKEAVRNVMSRLNTLRGPIAHCSPLAEDEVMRLHMTLRDWFRLMS